MEEIKIGFAEREDIPALLKLLLQVHKVHSDVRPDLFRAGGQKYTETDLEKILSEKRRPIFVARKGGEVVGYAFCIYKCIEGDTSLTDIRTLYIDDLCVDAERRGHHIGKQIYDYVVGYAKENGFYNVTLNVWADNVNAVKFYESIGLRVQKIGMEQIL